VKFDVNWNVAHFAQDFQDSFQETMEILGMKFTQAISSNIWDWPDGGTRDIVDTGQLRDSQQLIYTGPINAQFNWTAEYAAAVHQGATFKNGRVMRGRPWTEYTMNNFDVLETFSTIFRSKQ